METTSLWQTLQDGTSRSGAPGSGAESTGLWARLRERLDLALYRPEAAAGIIASSLTGREGRYYVLKNPATKTYYRLSERDYFLWERMDGTRTVKDLVVAFFLEYGSFAFGRAADLVLGLRANLFLSDKPVSVYRQVRSRLERRKPGHRFSQVWRAFLQAQFAIGGLDGVVGAIHRWGGWLLYTWPVQILFLLVSAVGLYAFVKAFSAGHYGVVTLGGSILWGLIGLLVANLVSVFLHEMSHALTVKHYGREVRRGGFMIYFGMPAFFVDTTDIWLEGKRARLAVTWAGPYSGLILGGLASIAILLRPEAAVNALLFQFAFLSFILVFFNLNPLLELDGYYMLMDSLEIPMLRRRSLAFIRSGLAAKVKGLRQTRAADAAAATAETGEAEALPPASGLKSIFTRVRNSLGRVLGSFSREEKIFTVFGILSAIWTAYAIYLGASAWQKRLASALRDLWTGGSSGWKIVLSLVIAALSLLFVVSIGLAMLRMAQGMLRWASQKGLFASPWRVAAVLFLLALVLGLAPGFLDLEGVLPFLNLAALTLAALLAGRNALDYAGSRFAPVFWLLGAFALGLLFREAADLALDRQLLALGAVRPFAVSFGFLAFLSLLCAGLSLFSGTKLRDLQPLERLLLLLGLAATCSLALWLALVWLPAAPALSDTLLAFLGAVAPVAALTLLVPTLFSFWRTAFGAAWATLALSLAGLTAVALLEQPATIPYLLLAAGCLLYLLAHRYIAFRRDAFPADLELSDGRRLQRAFGWTAAAVLAQFRQVAGDRSAGVLAGRFNSYAQASGWRVSLGGDQVEDLVSQDLGLIERGQAYAAALNLLLELVAQEQGEKLTTRALQRAYDRLPWEERELGAQYLFRDVGRAAELSAEFRAIQQDYHSLVRRIPLFATMDDGEIELLCSCLRSEQVAPGRAIIRQGESGDRFYLVSRGHVEVTQRDERGVVDVVNQLDRGGYFGELALLRDAPRNATCRATVPTEVLSLSRQDFDRLVKAGFALRGKVDRSIARANMLRRIPLFRELDGQQIQQMAAQLREEAYEPGAAIIREGEIGEVFYVIESGRVQVSTTSDGREKLVAERGPGEYVGEIALLLQIPRTATVTAITPTRVWALHKDDFDRLVAEQLYVSRGLERESSRRMIDLRRAAASSARP